MNSTKIMFSENEMNLMLNSEVILTKNNIIKKVNHLFGSICIQYQNIIQKYNLPEEVMNVTPKISKGEQYLFLPYVMLDFPRYFTTENKLAIRTFFWWGNFFSIQLHISGIYKKKVEQNFLKNNYNSWFFCLSNDEWNHDVNDSCWKLFTTLNDNDLKKIKENSFLKLSKKIPFNEWNQVENLLPQYFEEILDGFKN